MDKPSEPLFFAGLVIVVGFAVTRIWQRRSFPAYYAMRVAVFAALTVLLLKGGAVPYRPRANNGSEMSLLYVATLEIIWWLGAAWVAVGFSRAFIVWRGQPRQSKFVQDVLSGIIYLLALIGIIGDVFDLPVQGLLATSGAAAIVIGLALQSSLGDVFSGVVLNLERPYRVGDRIIVDDVVQGEVIETNWRSTHVLRSSLDIAIVPNSVIAKAKIINCSSPTPHHRISLRIRLEPRLSPDAACELLRDVLTGSMQLMRDPPPVVSVKDISAEALELELSATVHSYAQRDAAATEIYERLYRAAKASGVAFAPRLCGWRFSESRELSGLTIPQRLIAGVPLFAALTDDERAALANLMRRREFQPGEEVQASQALCVISDGVVIAHGDGNDSSVEVGRLAPGDYFGEHDLLTGESRIGRLTALTRVVVYEISKGQFAPLLSARPEMAVELSKGLISRYQGQPEQASGEIPDPGLSDRVTKAIRTFFSHN